MKKIVSLPNWVFFLFLILPAFLYSNTLLGLILLILWMGFAALGVYFLGNSLFKKLPSGHDLNINYFHFNLLFPLVYFLIVFIVFDEGYEFSTENISQYGWIEFIIFPLHFYAMFCLFFVIWFIAKSISTIENKGVVGFDNYAGNFFLVWFFPIGIWWVYPKIRKIFLADPNTDLAH